MNWLALLKQEKTPHAHASKPRKPTGEEEKRGFLGFLASSSAPLEKVEALEETANDTKGDATVDPNRWCWPLSKAMNGKEIDVFMVRVIRFIDKGIAVHKAESLADMLVIRDRDYDDRRLCLECAHLQGHGRWSCGKWAMTGVARDALAPDLVTDLHRCGGFTTHIQASALQDSRHIPRDA